MNRVRAGVEADAAGGVLFLFVDGVGLGPADPAVNPFAAARTPVLEELLGGPLTAEREPRGGDRVVFRSLGADLGHDGLPQSATGQTTLLTGRNAADRMGRHYGPWPGPTLRRALDEGSLFHEASREPPPAPAGSDGGGAALANLYPPGFFRALENGRLKVNACVYAARSAGVPLRDVGAYRRRSAVSADLDGRYPTELGLDPAPRGAAASGVDLAALAARHRFTLFDLWLTDRTGHRGTFAEALALVETFDAFLGGAIGALGPATTLVLTSDHGNLEDMSVGTHTHARVPLLAVGPAAPAFAAAESLTDVAPAIRAAWQRIPTFGRGG